MKVLEFTLGRPTLRSRLCLLALGLLVPCLTHAADAIWENRGTINTPPQIDATNFVNTGFIDIANSFSGGFVNVGTSLPFESSDTFFYTNSGFMASSPGWIFDFAPANTGFRFPADTFVNYNDGIVESLDGAGLIVFNTNGVLSAASSSPSYLWVNATNIINKGDLSVGGNGWLKITGTNVNMARGALEVTALRPAGSTVIGGTNYINDVGITDLYWGQTNFNFDSSIVYDGRIATAPPHGIQTFGGFGGGVRTFSVPQPLTFGYSNVLGGQTLTLTNADGTTTNVFFPTNIIKQAVFIGISDPTLLSASATFFPSTIITNPFKTVSVQLVMTSTNVITQEPDQTRLYFYDTFASETNRGLAVNVGASALPPYVFERPVNYDISRIDNGLFAAGTPGNANPDAAYLYDRTTYSNRFIVGAEYAGYGAFVDNLAKEPPPTTPGGVTNFPGRVQVYADKLDLTKTRIRGEGEVIIKANHLLSSAGAAVDCENLSYTLGSTNGNLNVTGLAKTSVIRMKGNLYAWSGLWSNQATVIITNNFVVTNTVDTNGVITGTNAIASPLTNTIVIGLYALILDARNLANRLPVTTWDLVTHSTNIVVSDSLSVVEALLLDGQSFTLNGNLTLTSRTLRNNFGQSVTTELLDFRGTNAPGIIYFTNNGTLSVPSESHFGDDRPVPYTDFINTGTLTSGSIDVNSLYIENDGQLSASVGPIELTGGLGLFQGGQSSSGGDIDFFFGGLKFNNHQMSVAGAVNFYVTNGLSDSGAASGNLFLMQNGFNLFIKPGTGDLLGTTFQDQPPNFVEVNHVWAGEDRGPSSAGYHDNAALGVLVLAAQTTNPLQEPAFFFTGANGHNALYVDLLDLTSLGTEYTNMLLIDPSLTIYYAAAKLGFTPPANANGIPQEPEEFLNGQFGGHLVWDSSFAGPNSSVDVVINGVTVSVNRALRFSKIIDSNGNGLPNFYDPFPFNANPLVLKATLDASVQPPSGSVAVSWKALAQKVYQVEFTTDVLQRSWQPLTRYTNSTSADSVITIWDTNAPAGTHRFYRVKTTP